MSNPENEVIDPALKEAVDKALAIGFTRSEIATAAGLDRVTLWRWINHTQAPWRRRDEVLNAIKALSDKAGA